MLHIHSILFNLVPYSSALGYWHNGTVCAKDCATDGATHNTAEEDAEPDGRSTWSTIWRAGVQEIPTGVKYRMV